MIAPNSTPIQSRKHLYIECSCDTCGTLFRWPENRVKAQKAHFCGKQCFKKGVSLGGVLEQKRKETIFARYGVTHQSKLPENKARKSVIMQKRCANGLQARREEAFRAKYGVSNPYRLPHIRQKVKERLGDENPFKTLKGQAKARKTTIQKYGVRCVFQLPQYKNRGNAPDAIKKRQANIRKNGGMKTSKVEGRFYQALCRIFGPLNILRDVDVNGWSIDFYIANLDCYVQFDGVYFHGLDREFNFIKSRVIQRTFRRDCFQNRWFPENGKVLVRVTDAEYKQGRESDKFVLDVVTNRINQAV